ncbi:hypothetical protein [Bradyrhizobium elkanii]|uniref:Uncharacterized protein n=1 Tax=Bradyrhizobium elkanii TaxID=29448 RepID=A0A8I2C4S0_BRAEL|nr:hypothetical protein [Bradyrhizobium elkanii]MBP1294263.1 hypothetical protein [Bradyrhizobium elkanii]
MREVLDGQLLAKEVGRRGRPASSCSVMNAAAIGSLELRSHEQALEG